MINLFEINEKELFFSIHTLGFSICTLEKNENLMCFANFLFILLIILMLKMID